MNIKKRYTQQQQQENISRKQIGEFFESHSFITGDISPDLGEDILVRIFENGSSTGLSFYLQLKSTDNINKHTLKTGDISYQLKTKDIEHWSAQTPTVVIGVWDINRRQGWWVWINDVIKFLEREKPKWKENKSVNIYIPLKNRFDEGGLVSIRFLLANLYYPVISKDKELLINTRFSFPKTEAGKAKFEELNRHFRTGDEVELAGEFIEKFDLPDWWKRIFGEIEPSSMHLKIGVLSSNKLIPVKFDFHSSLGDETIPFCQLTVIKQGSEEITLSSDKQKFPINFKLIFNKVKREITLSFNTDLSDATFPITLNVLKIQKILTAQGYIRLTFLETGEEINIPVNKGVCPSYDQNIIDFIEKICFIEKSMGIKIQPHEDGSFTREDVFAVDELISIIEKGNYHQKGLIYTIELYKGGIEEIIKRRLQDCSMSLWVKSDYSYVELFSQKIELGLIEQRIKGFWKASDEEVQEWLNHANDNDTLKVILEDTEIFEEFSNWKKK